MSGGAYTNRDRWQGRPPKAARTQFDVEQVALDGGAHRKLGRRAYRDLAQAVAEHDLSKLGQGRQALGQQVEQAGVIALLKRQAALAEIKVQGSRVHNAKLRQRIAGRNAGALLFERTARSTKTKEICRPITVGYRNLAGHKPSSTPIATAKLGSGATASSAAGAVRSV